jgi:hypothetical protein
VAVESDMDQTATVSGRQAGRQTGRQAGRQTSIMTSEWIVHLIAN